MDTEMITCTSCWTEKPVTEFSKRKASPNGFCYHCKLCVKEYKQKRRQRPEGRAMETWFNIYWRSENRDGHHPQYANIKLDMDKTEFIKWATPAIAEFMDKNPGVRLSVDRIDPDKSYHVANLRVIALSENSKLARHELDAKKIANMTIGLCKSYNVNPADVIPYLI
jgi:hypothetical protein